MQRAMTVRDVAQEYCVTIDTVYRWIKAGRLRPIRLPGGDYRFRREHLAEFDELCRVQSSPGPITDCASEAEFGSSTGPKAESPNPSQPEKPMRGGRDGLWRSGSPIVKLPSRPTGRQ